MKIIPATVILPVLVAPVFFATEYVTQPLPFPLPARIASHDESLVACQVQPDGAVILTLSAPPAAVDVLDVRPNR